MAKLIGTDPNQVPTNADLGTMAYTQVDNLPQISAKWVDVYNPVDRQSNLEIHTSDYYRDSGDPDLAYNWRFTNEGNANRLRLMGLNPNMSPANIFPLYVEGDTQDIVLSGNVRMSNGKGIDFSASEGGNASSSLLHDYEEGGWTPSVEASSVNPTVGYDAQRGRYTKVGRLVTLHFYIDTNSRSGGSGDLRVGGIPYAISNDSHALGASQAEYKGITMPSDANNIFIRVNPSATYLNLEFMDTRAGVSAALRGNIPIGNVGADSRILATVTYITDS